jgi:hypothetical protein
MLQHTQSHCLTCQRPTLFVRNTYDAPHVAHLMLFCALGLAAVVARDAVLSNLFAFAAVAWLGVWAVHAVANLLAAGQPFRCQQCGSVAASAAALADVSERQRLERAMAKAAAMKGKAASGVAAVALALAFATAGFAQAPARPYRGKIVAPTRFTGVDVGVVERPTPRSFGNVRRNQRRRCR